MSGAVRALNRPFHGGDRHSPISREASVTGRIPRDRLHRPVKAERLGQARQIRPSARRHAERRLDEWIAVPANRALFHSVV
jgi:hypothetical protein